VRAERGVFLVKPSHVQRLPGAQGDGCVGHHVLNLRVCAVERDPGHAVLQHPDNLEARKDGFFERLRPCNNQLPARKQQRRRERLTQPDRDCRKAFPVVVAPGKAFVQKLEVDRFHARRDFACRYQVVDLR